MSLTPTAAHMHSVEAERPMPVLPFQGDVGSCQLLIEISSILTQQVGQISRADLRPSDVQAINESAVFRYSPAEPE